MAVLKEEALRDLGGTLATLRHSEVNHTLCTHLSKLNLPAIHSPGWQTSGAEGSEHVRIGTPNIQLG